MCVRMSVCLYVANANFDRTGINSEFRLRILVVSELILQYFLREGPGSSRMLPRLPSQRRRIPDLALWNKERCSEDVDSMAETPGGELRHASFAEVSTRAAHHGHQW